MYTYYIYIPRRVYIYINLEVRMCPDMFIEIQVECNCKSVGACVFGSHVSSNSTEALPIGGLCDPVNC